uniref:Uncharacterized protein n=1 Tax=Anguilla anguilla TaxID=7936 RepID=A0A0E9QU04_ANGAN
MTSRQCFLCLTSHFCKLKTKRVFLLRWNKHPVTFQ